MRRALRFLFTLEGRVSRRTYALTGFGLMALKYGVEALAIRAVTGATWTPVDYFAPLFSVRAAKLAPAPDWFLLALGLWTLPFIWIGAAFTLRRARDAGLGGWAVVFFFAPLWNYLWMLFLSCRPARSTPEPPTGEAPSAGPALEAALVAVGVTSFAGLLLAVFCVYVAKSYGVALFLGVPFLLGLEAGYLFNRKGDQGLRATLSVAGLALALSSLLLLLFAFEGIICILMAAGIAWPIALFGAVFGHALALTRFTRRTALLPALLLPPFAFLEGSFDSPAEFEVVSSIDIDVPRERVWSHVVGFSTLPAPEHWIFSTGIAYPLRAEIEGQGVGAVRRCEFSTGAFVEPITRWEPPVRLSFDVAEAPLPMEEWSFYARVRPPHLEHAFRSLRGEFRLLELPGGRTRLEGSTWYRLELFPVGYWRFQADWIVHRIHQRVLEHVERLSEAQESAAGD